MASKCFLLTLSIILMHHAWAANPKSCDQVKCGRGKCCNDGLLGPICFDTGKYTCASEATGSQSLCGLGLSTCSGVCFNPSAFSCLNGVVVHGAPSQIVSSSQITSASQPPSPAPSQIASSTPSIPSQTPNPAPSQIVSSSQAASSSQAVSSSQAASPSNFASPVLPPIAAPAQYPVQTADVRIINSCKQNLWIEARYGSFGGPLPGQSQTATLTSPGGYVDYTVPATGLSGTRFWGKFGCDKWGRNCMIGDSVQYWPNPPGGCPAGGCTPPVDSLFEATFGCKPGTGCSDTNPTTWFDTSQVDGWTIPYKLQVNGETGKCDCGGGSNCNFKGVDATHLDLAKCPSNESLVTPRVQSSVTVDGQSQSLSSVDLRIIKNNQIIGCMSPCKKLNYGTPLGMGQSESSGSALWMCCPTPDPNQCDPSKGCVTSEQCRSGPVAQTQYVKAIHDMAPGIYSYAYDDGVGLHACPAGTVTYTVEFCPNGTTYPAPL